jgi:hypothetical protein
MKQEEFMRLKQGGDTVMQYLNKFNHLSQYAVDQVNTDLKKKNYFMRGLNDRLQRKMATRLDLTYSRAVSTTLAVEAKHTGPGKSKGFGGDRSSQGPEKRQRLVIQPFNQNVLHLVHPPTHLNSMSSFALPLPPLQQVSRVPLVLVSLPSLAPHLAASTVGSLVISSKTTHIRGRINPTISITQGAQIKARETWLQIQRARILRRLGEYITLKWPLHRRETRL